MRNKCMRFFWKVGRHEMGDHTSLDGHVRDLRRKIYEKLDKKANGNL